MNQTLSCSIITVFLCMHAGACSDSDNSTIGQSSARLENRAQLNFYNDWQTELVGELVAGAELVVKYDIDRLPQCFDNAHMGLRTWNTYMYVQFDGGPVTSHDVVNCNNETCNEPSDKEVILTIPTDAENASFWFKTSGKTCGYHWDSQMGENYNFPVRPSSPAWMGNGAATISRATSTPCGDGVSIENAWNFGTWARSRATVTDVCFEVWEPGVTDYDNPDLWKELDVKVHYRFDTTKDFEWEYVTFNKRIGNNSSFRWMLRSIDPMNYYSCIDVPTVPSNNVVVATLEYFFSVNGKEMRPNGAGSTYLGFFKDNPNNPHREEHCE